VAADSAHCDSKTAVAGHLAPGGNEACQVLLRSGGVSAEDAPKQDGTVGRPDMPRVGFEPGSELFGRLRPTAELS